MKYFSFNNKVVYSIDISEKPLDPDDRICGLYATPHTKLESIIKDYVWTHLERSDHGTLENVDFAIPEHLMMNKLKDILMNKNNDANVNNSENVAFELDCKRKLEKDISAVVVSIDSPTFSRTTKNQKATTLDKLAYIGNNLNNDYFLVT